MLKRTITVNGETITHEMIAHWESKPEMFNAQRGPLDPSGQDPWPIMKPTGLCRTCIRLKDGRLLESWNGTDFEVIEYAELQQWFRDAP